MKPTRLLPTLCLAAIALAACGGSKSEPAPAAPAKPVTTVTVDTEAVEEALTQAADEIAETLAEAADAITETVVYDGPVLTGTAWQVGDYELTFKSLDEVIDGTAHGKVQGKGGEIPAFMPNGMEFSYTLAPNGAIEIITPRGSFRGTYDGEKLVLDGSEATLLEQ